MDNKFDCTGRTALVSGASSGLGAHFAKSLAEHGARVIVAARRVDRLQALADEIELNGGEALAVQMDVCEADSVRAAFDRAEDAYGPVDIVSNNAGVVDQGLAVDIDEERWDFVLDTNLKGAWLVARESGRTNDRLRHAGKHRQYRVGIGTASRSGTLHLCDIEGGTDSIDADSRARVVPERHSRQRIVPGLFFDRDQCLVSRVRSRPRLHQQYTRTANGSHARN